jgi:hypothetical protein
MLVKIASIVSTVAKTMVLVLFVDRNMVELLVGLYHEEPLEIRLDTHTQKHIPNAQYRNVTKIAVAMEIKQEKEFNAKYHGEASGVYNCHGLTFANRRTGIYEDSALNLILTEEYQEIRNRKDVAVGDVAVYYENEGIMHSAVVIQVDRGLELNSIFVLSKSRSFKEIIHAVDNAPAEYGRIKRFYRMKHEPIRII